MSEIDRYLELAQQRVGEGFDPFACLYPAMVGMVLAGTADALSV
ncbi:hypothetical protein [Baekduia sp. Peel2402]